MGTKTVFLATLIAATSGLTSGQTTAPPSASPTSPAAQASAGIPNSLKKRVVVYTFEYKPKQEVGEAIRSMLQNRLTEQGQVVVVERAQIDAIEAELKRNAGGTVQPGTG